MHYNDIIAIIFEGSKTLRRLSGENFNERGGRMLAGDRESHTNWTRNDG
jgi:hypothetical protein